jgi:hypothetical protein
VGLFEEYLEKNWQFICVGITVGFSLWQLTSSFFLAFLEKSKSFFISNETRTSETASDLEALSCFKGACMQCKAPKEKTKVR